ncbi:hypothetical protein PQU92_09755 [Asticcacaulis sp. BYS171W]|uniref:Uncharacterized protein n=1 Tax=Asticcacaulis aquaticus TaxID=2984212 RepID=A0ABT5HU11_9CAUL|nr:hypothetical protein [Asticcacaulis aquaticus]MDC7683561.1 hypothetical protein [Asticcacaulis aquaticus]
MATSFKRNITKILPPDHQTRVIREYRNLANLNQSAATGRVLNLSRVYRRHYKDADYGKNPFFQSSLLNRCIILKHTLRLNERHFYHGSRRTVTKIILPYDHFDLRLGASSIYIGQVGFEHLARQYLSIDDFDKNPDMKILRLLDRLPSLDPFLVRETLARQGFRPDGIYLALSPADLGRMMRFTSNEIERLVNTALGEHYSGASMKLGNKILSDELDRELMPLKTTFRMTEHEFTEGIFAWRGFLYYKWRYLELQDQLRVVLSGIGTYQPTGMRDDRVKDYLEQARIRLAKGMAKALNQAYEVLKIYDTAYSDLVSRSKPGPFKRFLLNGSGLFTELGEIIGTLDHISSFWTFRMNKAIQTGKPMKAIEYADVLMDFESGLNHLFEERPTFNMTTSGFMRAQIPAA